MKTIKNFELKIRRVKVADEKSPYNEKITEPYGVRLIAQRLIGDSAQEHFIVLLLDVKNRVIGFSEAARGGIDSCPVDPRVVFRSAVATGASSIVVAHNHPSGDAEPSGEDLLLTEKLKDAGDLLGITLLDHVIITAEDTVSLRERGAL